MRLIAIRWTDAHDIGAGEWVDPENAEFGVVVTTVGHLVRTTDTHYVVTHTLDENGQARGLFAVPKVAVLTLSVVE